MAATERASMRRLYKSYIRTCRVRNIFWSLTLEQFQELTSRNCEYCQKPPSKVTRAYTYTGIDRKNNAQGYLPENVVACCTECNQIKGRHLTYDEMKAAMEVVCAIRAKVAPKTGGHPDSRIRL